MDGHGWWVGGRQLLSLGKGMLLTHEQLETNVRILSTVATDALVLEHQAISTHSSD